MMSAGAVSYAQPSVTKVGGITEYLKTVALADDMGVKLAPHSPYFGPGLLATLQLLSVRDDGTFVEMFYMNAGSVPVGRQCRDRRERHCRGARRAWAGLRTGQRDHGAFSRGMTTCVMAFFLTSCRHPVQLPGKSKLRPKPE